MANYDASSIKTLDYFEHIRHYPGMYIGSKDLKGLHHCAKEIISNSIDEFLNGAGNIVTIKLQEDGGLYVKDNGRGIPHGKHESGCSTLQACYGIANTGGKFDNETGKSGYNTSGGQHGTGGKAVNALSKKMVVSTSREGKKEIVEFSRGKFVSYEEEESAETGVEVLFYPDDEIFEIVKFDSEKLQTMIQEFSYLCTGLKFHFIDEEKKIDKEFLSTNGLLDYIKFLSKSQNLIAEPICFNERDGMFQVEVALAYTDSYSSIVKLYTNNIPQEKGTHLTGFKTALTSTFNAFAREKGWIKEKESNLTGADLEEGQILIINFKMIDPVFKGQNKEELSSSEGRTYVQKLSSIALKEYFMYNEKEVKKIADKALGARKAREAARKAREVARGIKQKKDKVIKFDTKLSDCYSKDRKKCEIMITEGDSASGNLKKARNNEFQAVLPVRGKILNTQKASLEKIQKNAEIMSMIQAFGLIIDIKNMKVTYHPEQLRYGKIIIFSDADIDGQHIKNLFYTFVWNFCPELILDGYIYAGVPPLYRVVKNKKYIYLKDDDALAVFRKEHQGVSYEVNRFKGLGEMSVDETEDTLINPQNRIIRQVTVNDVEMANKLFEDLMGTSSNARKLYLANHAKEAQFNA